jgi:hypothetical protein
VNTTEPHDRRHLVTLTNGAELSRAWLAANLPLLFRAWQHARTVDTQRDVADRISVAAAAMQEHQLGREPERRVVTVSWAESSRYQASFVLPLDASEADMRAEIARCPDTARRAEPVRAMDIHILGVEVDPDPRSGARAGVYTAAPSHTDRWAPLVGEIDPRLTEGPDWPPLAAAISHAAASGVDVATTVPELAAEAPLPERHPAIELHWRLMYAYASARPVPPACVPEGVRPAVAGPAGDHSPEQLPGRPPAPAPPDGGFAR